MPARAVTIALACAAAVLASLWIAPGTFLQPVADRDQTIAIVLTVVSLAFAPAIITAIVPRRWLLPWLALLALAFLAMDYRVFLSGTVTSQDYTGQDFLFTVAAIPAHVVNAVAAALRLIIRPRSPSPN